MRFSMRSGSSLLLAFLAAAHFATAQQTTPSKPASKPAAKSAPAASKTSAVPGKPVKVTSVEGITEYRLPNGLQVLLFPDPTKPTITVNVTYWSARASRATARPAWPTCSST